MRTVDEDLVLAAPDDASAADVARQLVPRLHRWLPRHARRYDGGGLSGHVAFFHLQRHDYPVTLVLGQDTQSAGVRLRVRVERPGAIRAAAVSTPVVGGAATYLLWTSFDGLVALFGGLMAAIAGAYGVWRLVRVLPPGRQEQMGMAHAAQQMRSDLTRYATELGLQTHESDGAFAWQDGPPTLGPFQADAPPEDGDGKRWRVLLTETLQEAAQTTRA